MRTLNNDFYINDWHIHPMLNRLSQQGNTVHVEPKVMEVLVCLAERAGEVVTRDELMKAVWKDIIIHEDVLSRSISELRKIFGDHPQKPEYIETIYKRGYRLIATVTSAEINKKNNLTAKHIAGVGILALIFIAGFSFLFPNREPAQKRLPLISQPVTTYSGREIDPSFSPDGQKLAFAWDKGTGQFDIYAKVIGSEGAMRLTNNSAMEISPSWSPDGRFITFVSIAGDNCNIRIMPVTGGTARNLTDCIEWDMVQPKWMPDGKHLIYSDRISVHDPYRIISLSTATLQKNFITSAPRTGMGDIYPAISPDGTQLAFVRSNEGRELRLFISSTGMDGSRPLSDEIFQKILDLEWMPDGNHLVFTGFRENRFGLWKISVQDGEIAWLPTGMDDVIDLTIYPSKNEFAYEKRMSDDNIWRIIPTGIDSSPVRIIASTKWDSKPKYSPDGNYIAFQSTRSGQHEIWMSDKNGDNLVQLTSLDNVGTRDPAWSPDGRKIGFSTNIGESADLYSVEITRGIIEPLTLHPADELDLQWSSDGEMIYYRSNRSGDWDIWKQRNKDSNASQITDSGDVTYFTLSRGFIYYSRTNISGLWQLPAQGGNPTKILENLSSNASRNWIVGKSGIYFAKVKTPSEAFLSFYDFNTKKITNLTSLENLSVFSGFSLSPGENHLLYARTDRSESDVILVKNFR